MKSSKKSILLAGLSVAMCVSLIAGATFAIFSSKNTIDISVSSGKINLVATSKLESAWSADANDNSLIEYLEVNENSATFTNGGTVSYTEDGLTLTNITPGDGVALKVDFTNYSSIRTKYKVSVAPIGSKNALYKALEIDTVYSVKGEKDDEGWYTAEIPETADGEYLGYAKVEINFPIEVSDSTLQGQSCDIAVSVQAYQWNAHIEEPEEETGNVILNSSFMNKIKNAIAGSGIEKAPAIIFGTWGNYQNTVTAVDDYSAYEDGVEIPGEINAKLFRVADNTRMFRAAALEEDGASIGVDAIYVLAGNSIAAAGNADESFMFADTDYVYVDMSGVDFSKTTSLGNMFKDSQIETLIMRGVNLSGLTTLINAFASDTTLQYIDFSGADLSNVESMGAMFLGCSSLISADFSYAQLSSLTTMGIETSNPSVGGFNDPSRIVNDGAFQDCTSLKSVNFAHADLEQVEDMSYMFYYCKSLESFTFTDVFEGCVFPNLKTISKMFYMCYGLTQVDFSNAQLASVEDISGLCHDCTSLLTANFTEADLSGVTYTGSGMFQGTGSVKEIIIKDAKLGPDICSRLFYGVGNSFETLDFSGADFEKVTNMSGMFEVGENEPTVLKSVSFNGAKNLDNVTSMYKMFMNCTALEDIDFTNCNFSNVENTAKMFSGCKSLKKVDFTGVVFTGVTGESNSTDNGMAEMFAYCTKLEYISFKEAQLTNVGYFSQMFISSGVQTVDFTGANLENVTSSSFSNIFYGANDLKTVIFKGAHLEGLTSLDSVFNASGQYRGQNVKSVDFSGAFLNNVTSMCFMFSGVSTLKTVNFSGAHLENLKGSTTLNTGMNRMFNNCANIESLDFSDADLRAVNGISASTLLNNSNAQKIYFSGADLRSMTSLSFGGLSKLDTIDFSGATLTSLATMNNMFQNCTSLTSFDFSTVFAGFNLSQLKEIQYMFDGCTSLKSVDLGDADFGTGVRVDHMFRNCENLQYIYVNADKNLGNGNWRTNMGAPVYTGCVNLPNYGTLGDGVANSKTEGGYFTVKEQ